MWAERLDASEMTVHAMHPGWADTPGVEKLAAAASTGSPSRCCVRRRRARTRSSGSAARAGPGARRAASGTTGAGGRLHLLPGTTETAADRERLWAECERLAAGRARGTGHEAGTARELSRGRLGVVGDHERALGALRRRSPAGPWCSDDRLEACSLSRTLAPAGTVQGHRLVGLLGRPLGDRELVPETEATVPRSTVTLTKPCLVGTTSSAWTARRRASAARARRRPCGARCGLRGRGLGRPRGGAGAGDRAGARAERDAAERDEREAGVTTDEMTWMNLTVAWIGECRASRRPRTGRLDCVLRPPRTLSARRSGACKTAPAACCGRAYDCARWPRP